MKKSPWFVYIIENEKGSLYTGITTDIERRLSQHSGEKKGGAKSAFIRRISSGGRSM